jgi:hypothetical protein
MKHEEENRWNRKEKKEDIDLPAPVPGLNDNLDFMGKQLHIQTENSEFPSSHIVTQVFSGGRVVLSKKSEHPHDIRTCGDARSIQELMRSQHQQIIKEIRDKQVRLQQNATQSVDASRNGTQ